MKSPSKLPAAPSQNQIPISFPRKPVSVIKLPHLESALKKVAAARSKFYSQKIAVLVRWDDDNTGAEDDLNTMESILKLVGVKCIRFSIESSAQLPVYGITDKVRETVRPCANSSLPSLFIFYYSGHGAVKDGMLRFTSNGKEVRWSHIFSELHQAELMDHFVILDCCHAAAAIREPDAKSNIHIIAAVGEQEITPARAGIKSFTQRLFRAFQTLKKKESFTTAEWFEQLQIEKPKFAPNAIFETFRGTGQISLILNNQTPSRLPRPISGVSRKHVLVKLTLEGQRNAVESFSRAIRQLPPNMKVEIRDAFETDASVFFMLQMSWEGWVLWTRVVHLEFVGTTLGPSLISRAAIPPVLASEENMPLENLSLKDA